MECEQSGIEHAASGHFHHAARGDYADDNADRGDGEDDPHRSGLGADGRVEEIDCVVRDADEKT